MSSAGKRVIQNEEQRRESEKEREDQRKSSKVLATPSLVRPETGLTATVGRRGIMVPLSTAGADALRNQSLI